MDNSTTFDHTPRFAYFSMEIALAPEIPTYAGGLGLLAGDLLRAAADLELPFVAVTLVSRRGYFRQHLGPAGAQQSLPQPWLPEQHAARLDAAVAVPIDGRRVWVSGWLYRIEGPHGATVPVILLDTDLPVNAEEDRGLTDSLYGGDDAYRLRQEAVLGIGGVRLLQALRCRVSHYHLNEGHSALLTAELVNQFMRRDADSDALAAARDAVRRSCTFTTHTPVEAGHDRFDFGLASRIVGEAIGPLLFAALTGGDELNMTRLALGLSGFVNGVALRHAEVSRAMFPAQRIHAITNGVHAPTWTSAEFAALYDHVLPRWRNEPEVLVRADCCVSREAIRQAHQAAKRRLLTRMGRAEWREDALLIGFARRMTAYKRPTLLFADLERLRALARRQPMQLVVAGKAHPRDEPGQALIRDIHRALEAVAGDVPGMFIADYDMGLGRDLVAGTDLWLNTPQPPLEASGTSGMKAALNGVPSLSVLDGWWVEGHIEGVTGWAIDGPGAPSDAADALYVALEQKVLPAFADPDRWIRAMTGAIAKTGAVFTAHRMLRRYVTEAYTARGAPDLT